MPRRRRLPKGIALAVFIGEPPPARQNPKELFGYRPAPCWPRPALRRAPCSDRDLPHSREPTGTRERHRLLEGRSNAQAPPDVKGRLGSYPAPAPIEPFQHPAGKRRTPREQRGFARAVGPDYAPSRRTSSVTSMPARATSPPSCARVHLRSFLKREFRQRRTKLALPTRARPHGCQQRSIAALHRGNGRTRQQHDLRRSAQRRRQCANQPDRFSSLPARTSQ